MKLARAGLAIRIASRMALEPILHRVGIEPTTQWLRVTSFRDASLALAKLKNNQAVPAKCRKVAKKWLSAVFPDK
jgi:hypothetical protein